MISFKEISAKRVYNSYMERCKKAVRTLPVRDQEECLMEVNSHIYEFLTDHGSEDEMKPLLDVLDRLGSPEETLKEIVASKKIDQATRTYNPKHLFQALVLNISNGVTYLILFLLYVLLICFPILAILKIIRPDQVGYFTSDKGTFSFGYISTPDHAKELLGYWFIPIMFAATVGIYLVIIFALRLLRKIKIKNNQHGSQTGL